MSGIYKVAAGIFVAIVLVATAVYFIWFAGEDSGSSRPLEVETPLPLPAPTPTPSLQERLSARLSGTTLSTSDAIVRDLVAELSSHPKLAAWLANEDLIRRFTAAVDNIADGVSPKAHLEFMQPSGSFKVKKKGDTLVINPACYSRYDLAAEVFASLDDEGTVALYRELRPLIDEAYREIAPANRSFDQRLVQAMDHLLAVPIREGDIKVTQRVLTYAFSDDTLESLSDAQRHLLRMGPDNVKRVQDKLSVLKAALF